MNTQLLVSRSLRGWVHHTETTGASDTTKKSPALRGVPRQLAWRSASTTKRNGWLEGKMGIDECRWETRHTRQNVFRKSSPTYTPTCTLQSALSTQWSISRIVCALQRQLSTCRDWPWWTSTRTQSWMLNASFIRRTGAYYSATNEGGVVAKSMLKTIQTLTYNTYTLYVIILSWIWLKGCTYCKAIAFFNYYNEYIAYFNAYDIPSHCNIDVPLTCNVIIVH